jgi:Flp pilus assembly protein TadG
MKAACSILCFLKCRSGGPALEFALIAPMMAFVMMTSFDIVELMQANRRAENVAASLSDVVSRDVEVSNEEHNDIVQAIRPLLHPSRITRVRVRITSAMVRDASRAEVVWSEGVGGLRAHRQGALISVPRDVGQTQTGVVIVEFQGQYRPPLGMLANSIINLRHIEYRRPRVVDPVGREGVTWTP